MLCQNILQLFFEEDRVTIHGDVPASGQRMTRTLYHFSVAWTRVWTIGWV